MPNVEGHGPAEPQRVSILTQGPYLIASIHTALDDGQLQRFQRDVLDLVGRQRSRGIVIDVATLDVLDSFATTTLTDLAQMARLRGAETVIVGITPELAIAMVQLALKMDTVRTALDLEEGIERLAAVTGNGHSAASVEKATGL